MLREAYAHDAVVVLDQGGDARAPGGAITVALCGSWDHEPPCPLAPHHTAVEQTGERVQVRVVFATTAPDEPEVRRRIEEALSAGFLVGPDARTTRWELRSSASGDLRAGESGLTEQLRHD